PKTATYPPRDPLTTSSTDHLSFDRKIQSQNQMLRLIPLVELTSTFSLRWHPLMGIMAAA
ncbi:MAG: hypothetical protein KBG62_02945, partial [Propionivibrio sp.]|nr:hypothetical protein [Propionivibrio sp.]